MWKNVAMSEAQRGAFARTGSSAFVVFTIGTAKRGVGIGVATLIQRFGVGFLDRAGDHVTSTRPFTKVDQPAAFGAEGKVGFVAQHDLAAGGTTQAADFLGHPNILPKARGEFADLLTC